MPRKKTTADQLKEELKQINQPLYQELEVDNVEADESYRYIIATDDYFKRLELLNNLATIFRDESNEIESIVTDDSLGEKEASFRLGNVYGKLDNACNELETVLFQMDLTNDEEVDDSEDIELNSVW